MKRSTCLLAVLLTSSAAQAANIQYQFTGTVTDLTDSLLPDFALGESVVVSVTADDTVRGTSDESIAYYDALDLTLTIGGDYTVTGALGDVRVLNDFGSVLDAFHIDFYRSELSGPPLAAGAPEYFSLARHFPTDVFASVALPLSLPLDLVTSGPASLRFGVGGGSVGFRIDSVTIVPEPATGLLALCGLLGLAWRGRRTP